MKKLAVAALLFLPACHPGAGYVKADRLTYDAVAPAFVAYVNSDQSLDSDQRKRRIAAVESWDARIKRAENPEDGEVTNVEQ